MEPPAFLDPAGASACARCGDFAPLTPVGARWLCAPCIAKRHPILAEPASAGLYVAWSFKLIGAIGRPAAAMWIAVAAATVLANVALQEALGLTAEPTPMSLVAGFAGMAIYLVGYTFGAGFQTALAVQAIDGPVDWRAAARLTRTRYPSLLGAATLASAGMFFGCMCCLAPGVVLSMLWALPFPAIIAHGVGPFAALSRSTRAVSDAWAPIGLALTVVGLVWFAAYLAVSLPASGYLLAEALESGPAAMAEAARDPWVRALSLVTTSLASLAYIPLVNTPAVAYLNRTEGANSDR